jgi:hypothetical protein
MAKSPRIRIVEATDARRRLDEALAFLREAPRGTEILTVGPTREAVDDLVRELAKGVGATFGIHRFGFWQLVAHVASSELAAGGLAPATVLGMEAVAARAAFDADSERKIPRPRAHCPLPGFPSALAATSKSCAWPERTRSASSSSGEGPEGAVGAGDARREGRSSARTSRIARRS